MKLSELSEDEGLGVLFARLVQQYPPEILVFSPETNPVFPEAEVHFFFPCNESSHGTGCGFFRWVNTIKSFSMLCEDIEAQREEGNLDLAEMAAIFKDEESWPFNIIIYGQKDFNNNDIKNHTINWINTWVDELRGTPIRLIDLLEHRRLWSRYEEFHIKPEAKDGFFQAMRDIVNGTISQDMFENMQDIIDEYRKDEEDGD